jgi:hypothetical protein
MMSVHVERREFARELEPFGLLTEGAAGVAVIVLAVIALAGVSTHALASIAAIVIGGGLMVQAMNSAAEHVRPAAMAAAGVPQRVELAGDVLVDCMCGVTGIILGILALVGIAPAPLLSAALIVYGGALLVSGAASAVSPGLLAAAGMEMLIGIAAVVLGIVSVLMASPAVLVLVGFLAVGAALLLVSASFGSAVWQFVRTV